MSKSTIRYRDHTKQSPGFHLYEDPIDTMCSEEGEDVTVFLRLDGVPVDLSYNGTSASVTMSLPRELATELGLLTVVEARAMRLALDLLARGCARMEPMGEFGEFAFDGLRFALNGSWAALMNVIGWNKARAALAAAGAS